MRCGTPRAGMAVMNEKHPDAPEGGTVDEELNDTTRDSMEQLGRADLPDDPAARAEDEEGPGQNSERLPQ